LQRQDKKRKKPEAAAAAASAADATAQMTSKDDGQVLDPRKSDGSTCSKGALRAYLHRENKKRKEQEAAAAAGEGA